MGELRCVRCDSVVEEVSGAKGVCDFQWDRMEGLRGEGVLDFLGDTVEVRQGRRGW